MYMRIEGLDQERVFPLEFVPRRTWSAVLRSCEPTMLNRRGSLGGGPYYPLPQIPFVLPNTDYVIVLRMYEDPRQAQLCDEARRCNIMPLTLMSNCSYILTNSVRRTTSIRQGQCQALRHGEEQAGLLRYIIDGSLLTNPSTVTTTMAQHIMHSRAMHNISAVVGQFLTKASGDEILFQRNPYKLGKGHITKQHGFGDFVFHTRFFLAMEISEGEHILFTRQRSPLTLRRLFLKDIRFAHILHALYMISECVETIEFPDVHEPLGQSDPGSRVQHAQLRSVVLEFQGMISLMFVPHVTWLKFRQQPWMWLYVMQPTIWQYLSMDQGTHNAPEFNLEELRGNRLLRTLFNLRKKGKEEFHHRPQPIPRNIELILEELAPTDPLEVGSGSTEAIAQSSPYPSAEGKLAHDPTVVYSPDQLQGDSHDKIRATFTRYSVIQPKPSRKDVEFRRLIMKGLGDPLEENNRGTKRKAVNPPNAPQSQNRKRSRAIAVELHDRAIRRKEAELAKAQARAKQADLEAALCAHERAESSNAEAFLKAWPVGERPAMQRQSSRPGR